MTGCTTTGSLEVFEGAGCSWYVRLLKDTYEDARTHVKTSRPYRSYGQDNS